MFSQVLLLNGTHDRETSGFTASCFVTAITDALNRTYGDPHNCLQNPVSISGHLIGGLVGPLSHQLKMLSYLCAAKWIHQHDFCAQRRPDSYRYQLLGCPRDLWRGICVFLRHYSLYIYALIFGTFIEFSSSCWLI